MTPDLSVVIVSFNTRLLLDRCLRAVLLAAGDSISLEIIVVDNGSSDGTIAHLRERYPQVIRLRNRLNTGFAAANNRGLAAARAPLVLLLNSDAFITATAIRRALDVLDSCPRVGLVGTRLDNPDGTVQAEAGTFPTLWDDIASSLGIDRFVQRGPRTRFKNGPADWVQGACMFVRAAAVREAGLLDESFFMYSEEVDWCRRFWLRGWEVWYLGDVGIIHLGSASSSSNDLGRRIALYRSRLGLRRRLGGPLSSLLLWLCMLVGLSTRASGRLAAQSVMRGPIGRHSAQADWRLLRAVARMDPLARWAIQ